MTALTTLLHRAYAPLGAAGMRYLASHQDEAMTRTRCGEGECLVAADGDDVIVGTVVLVPPDRPSDNAYYNRVDVAWFQQFAVHPAQQGCGIGGLLMDAVEQRAASLGASYLALDTAVGATNLIAMYTRRGYIIDACTWWDVTNYRSVIMSQHLAGLADH